MKNKTFTFEVKEGWFCHTCGFKPEGENRLHDAVEHVFGEHLGFRLEREA